MSQGQVVYGNVQPAKGQPQNPNQQLQANGVTKVEDGVTNVDDMVPVMACCCSITSFYCPSNCGSMCGCFGQSECLCCQNDFTFCKFAETTSNACCILQKARLTIIKPVTCVQMTAQVFCCDHRCALPCSKDVPCLVSVFGITCAYDYKAACHFCNPVSAMKPPPPPQQPTRF